jgi:hypothetical protein
MWEFMIKNCNGGISPNLSNCKFIGSSAGRRVGGTIDRGFAFNLGVRFETSENFALGKKEPPFSWGSKLDPNDYLTSTETISFHPSKTTEMIVMIGYPSSGIPASYFK